MFKLRSGETLAQANNFDKAPAIVNFVQVSQFIKAVPVKSSTSVIIFGK